MLKYEKYTLKGDHSSLFEVLTDRHLMDQHYMDQHYIWSPEGGLCQQAGGVVGVLHVGHGDGGVGHPVVDHSVHRHRHRVAS